MVWIVVSYDEDERDQDIDVLGVYKTCTLAKEAILKEIEQDCSNHNQAYLLELLDENGLFEDFLENLPPGDLVWENIYHLFDQQLANYECRGLSRSYKIFQK